MRPSWMLAIALALTACDGGGGSSSPPTISNPVTITEVTFSPNPALVGNSLMLTVNGSELSDAIEVSLDGCSVTAVPTTSTTSRQYTCTPLNAGSNFSGSVKNTAGIVIFTFVVAVNCAAGQTCGATTNSGTEPLNDTGIYWCANDLVILVDCLIVDILYVGQDANDGRDAQARAGLLVKSGGGNSGFDFTKIGADGQPLEIQDASWSDVGSEATGTTWSCVRDNHTGLTWEMKVRVSPSLHHMSYKYTWYNADSNTNGGSVGTENGGSCLGSNCDTQSFTAAVNAQGLCGAIDWRMPSKRELITILDLGLQDPAIDTGFFPNTQSTWFWTSSPNAQNGAIYAWGVHFNGGVASLGKSDAYPVRLVRTEH